MSNKRIYLILIVSFVIGLIGVLYFYLTDTRYIISFTLSDDVSSITITDEERNEVAQLDNSTEISLSEGRYFIIPTGERIDNSAIDLFVSEEKSVVIDPDFSVTYYQSLLEEKLEELHTIITTSFARNIQQYTIDDGLFYEKAEYYATILRYQVDDTRQEKDNYRIVLRKDQNEWVVAAGPEIILTSHKYPEVPTHILLDMNQQF